ncbi:C-type lectin lectoxin-Lio3-like [Teleopsis dalmanni]|uniref:C-type lectin lectoxin-Lio3-like n=1 Tax=Teleopsis dalmanni TaxID=139649 RepID=UPI0018CDD96D|nr:C-type lectin lectoxin-Lio3-like [Teleopsis dalmanni]XP_037945538.1 C-type lectin lectoxin-Lio3-like [Teleopsis dalmanni]
MMKFLIYLMHIVAFLYIVVAQQTQENNTNSHNGGSNNNNSGSFFQSNGSLTGNNGSNYSLMNGFNARSVPSYSLGAFAKVNWFTAQRICKYNGLTLASITSAAEAKEIRSLIRDSEIVSPSELFWIGATKYPDNGDYWSWFGTGNPATYTNWATGQPNSRSDYCLQVGSSGWDDKNCNIQAYFICQPSTC